MRAKSLSVTRPDWMAAVTQRWRRAQSECQPTCRRDRFRSVKDAREGSPLQQLCRLLGAVGHQVLERGANLVFQLARRHPAGPGVHRHLDDIELDGDMEPGEHRQALLQIGEAREKHLSVLRGNLRNHSIADYSSSSVGVLSL